MIERVVDPVSCLLDHILSLALHDGAFAVSHFSDVSKIFEIQIPSYKRSVPIRWKTDFLNIPIFRQPERSLSGNLTSSSIPPRSSTWTNYLKTLGVKVGLEHLFTQYVIRRGLLNAINSQ